MSKVIKLNSTIIKGKRYGYVRILDHQLLNEYIGKKVLIDIKEYGD